MFLKIRFALLLFVLPLIGVAGCEFDAASVQLISNRFPDEKGERVRQVQQALWDIGLYQGIVDGRPSKVLDAVISDYKKRHQMFPSAEIGEVFYTYLVGLNEMAPSVSLQGAALADDTLELRRHLKAGAEVDGRDANGWTALQYAVLSGSQESVTLLLEAGASVDLATPQGHTPVMIAVIMHRPRALSRLFKFWPDILLKNRQDMIAEEIAFNQNRMSLMALFRRHRLSMEQSRLGRRLPFPVRVVAWDRQECERAQRSRFDVVCQVVPECRPEKNAVILCDAKGEPYVDAVVTVLSKKWGQTLRLDAREKNYAGPLLCQEGDVMVLGVK